MQDTLFGGVQRETALEVAAPLRELLGRDATANGALACGHPLLVVFSGLPGTGKSHFARSLTARLPLVVLESDRLRRTMVAKPQYTPEEHGRVFSACHLLIEEFLSEGRRVLFDATNLTENFRQPLYDIAERTSSPLIVVRFTAPQGVVRKRLESRLAGANPGDNSEAGWTVYCKMAPFEQPIPRGHLTVDSSASTSWALEQIVRQAVNPTNSDGSPGPV